MIRLRWTWIGVALLVACGGGPEEGVEESEPAAEPDVATEVAQSDEEPQRTPFLPDEMMRPGGRPGFSHEPHVEISCTECHERVRGHGSHAELRCAECHAASEQATRTGVTPAQCLSCHHGQAQTASCSDCHEPVGVRTVQRTLALDVWPAPRQRRLVFDHTLHEAERCEACHETAPSLAPRAPCTSCHEDHHRPEARCATCHEAPPQAAHDLEAHLGCSGAGCHTDPALESLAQTRSGCLVCHQAQEQHEVGKECAGCHQVREEEP